MSLELMRNVERQVDESLVNKRGDVFEVHVFTRHTPNGLLTEREEYLIYNRYCKLGYVCSFHEFNDLAKGDQVLFNKVMSKLRLTTDWVEQSFIDDFLSESSYYRVFVVERAY